MKRSLAILLAILLTFSVCKKKKDNKSGLFLLGLLYLQQSNTSDCENKTGLVICIPPGLRQ